ncbi:peptidase [Thalassobaculum fulvum]|uniref:Peptidase n=1 Tax=Thalassobaculum fulvum TaxID=1633335 RepID=A0A918XTK5_9PROT|nr:M23 family metallopeptidase [Thalassobaculum fulvum]GHD55151.1 peptidase [Thalassobaculum fulvum]
MRGLAFLLTLLAGLSHAHAKTSLDGNLVQGGLVIGHAEPGSTVVLDGRTVRVDADGLFVLGFHRDAAATAELTVTGPDGKVERRTLAIAPREWNIQRIDGLPKTMVTPPPEVLERIRRENAEIAAVRRIDRPEALFRSGFAWPATGRISGVYGSQRILNGEPRQPHYGVDIAAPVGTPVKAPADGVVVLAANDLYYTGGTVILDHGHGLSSAFLHLSAVTVKVGDRLRQGEVLGKLGATGRATGPHLDWRMNWFEERIDPQLLVPPMPGS